MLRTTSYLLSVFLLIISCTKTSETKNLEVLGKKIDSNQKVDIPTSPQRTPRTYKKFKGAWFDIEYPDTFKAENSLRSYTNSEGFDSAIFTSADGKVQFYVFSPQWSGEPTDIKVKAGEKISATSEEKKNGLFVKRWTVEANDGSYSRAYEETSENVSHTNKVFGIKYASKADLERYREEYLHFKNSLTQFAD